MWKWDVACGTGEKQSRPQKRNYIVMRVNYLQAREGYRNLTGVDYSERAIELAETVIREQNISDVISLKVGVLLCLKNAP